MPNPQSQQSSQPSISLGTSSRHSVRKKVLLADLFSVGFSNSENDLEGLRTRVQKKRPGITARRAGN